MAIMQFLKQHNLWQVSQSNRLAGKRGRWVAGRSRALKDSEHYPEHLGIAVSLILAGRPYAEILARVRGEVQRLLQADAQPVLRFFQPPVANGDMEEDVQETFQILSIENSMNITFLTKGLIRQ